MYGGRLRNDELFIIIMLWRSISVGLIVLIHYYISYSNYYLMDMLIGVFIYIIYIFDMCLQYNSGECKVRQDVDANKQTNRSRMHISSSSLETNLFQEDWSTRMNNNYCYSHAVINCGWHVERKGTYIAHYKELKSSTIQSLSLLLYSIVTSTS